MPVSTDVDCLFCKIVAGEIPADVVAQNDEAVAFRDVNPQAPTHALVVPRDHYADAATLADGAPETVAALVRLARDVARDDGVDDYRLVFNTGPGSGQTVFHTHLHVLGGRAMTWPPG
jgi:histidine triad (HIT) family protein